MIEEKQNLNDMLKSYRQGIMDRKGMEGMLFMYIRNHPRRFFLSALKRDVRDDFLGWLYPRLKKTIDHYVDKGSCFDVYIAAMIRLSVREYGLRKKEHQIIERTWWDAKAEEMKVLEEEPDYPDIPPEKVSNPRQVLMLLLKSYYYLSDNYIERLAPVLGLEKEKLYLMVDKLRVVRAQREEAINGLKERIHGQFYRNLTFEKRMRSAVLCSAHWYRMKRCLENGQKRLASMRRRLSSMHTGATNEQVAAIMRVAKGTIDSNLFAVRQRNREETGRPPAE